MKVIIARVTLLVVLGAIFFSPAAHATTEEERFVSLTNTERTRQGIHKLVVKSDLTAIARNHSQSMAEDETIYHNQNLPNQVPGNWTALGENVGMGPSVQSIHNAFMDSPGHRANILDPDYTEIGIGVAIRDDTIYVTEVFAHRTSSQPKPKPKPKPKPNPKTSVKVAPPPPKKKPTIKPKPTVSVSPPASPSTSPSATPTFDFPVDPYKPKPSIPWGKIVYYSVLGLLLAWMFFPKKRAPSG